MIGHACPAMVTVKSVFLSSHSAYSTFIAVENLLFLGFIVKEFAHVAIIASEFNSAIVTRRFNLYYKDD
jgi:hypothetical protein